jgi:hypothetical protein
MPPKSAETKLVTEDKATTPGLKHAARLWASGMDEPAIERAGLSALQPLLDAIAGLKQREQLPALMAQLARAHTGKLRVLAVNYKESPAAVAQFAATAGLELPTLRDPDGALARAWGIRVFPSTVLVGADGRVRSVVRGALDWNGAAAQPLIAPLLLGAEKGVRLKPAAQQVGAAIPQP